MLNPASLPAGKGSVLHRSLTAAKAIVAFVILLLPVFTVPGLASGSRTNFLSHGPSVAAFGRGETGSALPSDFSSYHYNPSLVAPLRERNIIFSHFSLFDGSMYNFAGYCQPVKAYTVGVSAVNLRSGDVEVRQKIDDTPSLTQANQWAYTLTLAGRVKRLFDLNCGLNVKYVYYDMLGYKDGGLGADLGFSREMKGPVLFTNKTTIDAGAAVQNIVPPSLKLASERETLNTIYRLGAALSMPVVYRFLSADTVVLLTDLSLEDSTANILAGLEYQLMDKYIFRGGYYNGHITSGLGYRDQAIRVDYALDLSDFSLIHRLGFSYFWTHSGTVKETAEAPGTNTRLSPLMKEAKQALKDRKIQLAEQRKRVNALFKAAKKDYLKNRYLLATEKFREILLQYPESANAKEFYTNIVNEMNDTAGSDTVSDFEKLSYAKGYVDYYKQDFPGALNEWEKVLELNPERSEVAAYRTNVKQYLEDAKKRAKEQETEAAVKDAFAGGQADYTAKNWVACIRKMEKVQAICRSDPFPRALEWLNRSQEYIDLSVTELAKSVKHEQASRKIETVAERAPAVEVDVAGAEKKYNEGLILYAQGKISDAINLWEIAVRLNPGNDKAQKALKKAKEELELRKKL